MPDFKDIYYDVFMSTVKWTQDQIAQITADGIGNPRYIDWDQHAEIHELDSVDYIGPGAVTLTDDGGDSMLEATVMIGVSSYDDTNLFRQRRYMSRIFDKLRYKADHSNRFALYNADSTTIIGWMIPATPTTASPMERSETRPFQFVQARLLIDPSASRS